MKLIKTKSMGLFGIRWLKVEFQIETFFDLFETSGINLTFNSRLCILKEQRLDL